MTKVRPQRARPVPPAPLFTPVNSLPEEPDRTRRGRLRWWEEARYGMFIHFGPYAVLGRGEWALQQERIPLAEYTPLAEELQPTPGSVRSWVRLARRSGMKYAVLTAKHCDGFLLWDGGQSDFNAARRGPGRDLVREFVTACRAEGLRVGLYYGLMDWRHPDGDRCAVQEAARRRFVRFTHENVRELMTGYGKIDILWFDGPWPMPTAEQWESRELIRMVRRLQPDILINNRARLAEDFGTPEGEVVPMRPGRAWEACLTLNGDWGYSDTPEDDWISPRTILRHLRKAAAYRGNLLLNIGPRADGSLPPPVEPRLRAVGRWLARHGEAVYGSLTRLDGRLEPWVNTGFWTLRDRVGYYWLLRGYPGARFGIGGLVTPVTQVELLGSDLPLSFAQSAGRLLISGLPRRCPERTALAPVLRITFARVPRQVLGGGMRLLPKNQAAWW